MEKQTKILLGLAAIGVVAYLVLKPKKAVASTPISKKKLTPKVISDDIKKELPIDVVKEVPKGTTPIIIDPTTPATPITPSTPINTTPPTPFTPLEPQAPIIQEIPAFDFEQYFKEHPIVFDIDPNVGSTMVVNPPAYGNTDPFAKYDNCITLEQYFDLKARGVPMSPDVCIQGNALIISDKERQQNAFQMKDVQNELSRDMFGSLSSFMTQGQDHTGTYIGGWAGGDSVFPISSGGGALGGSGLSQEQRDLFRMGYGGDFSA